MRLFGWGFNTEHETQSISNISDIFLVNDEFPSTTGVFQSILLMIKVLGFQ